ncbi:hypothetical protein CkaCkLH20_11089 [Colletotrichum karsti]|uniref:DJ-1/PfpI domain-containing protein n=1 Tax=Colletotrichum karsti TaxID=1095194 RepID=A0A9P6LGH3_9PEZI|nr:uncharacterized protein CkaCkLH20_11089 [Colletotrichum karsti]KAF9871442.1 hypothetical protein CkaCkLH20_11089 [Colletotrichum karsti]
MSAHDVMCANPTRFAIVAWQNMDLLDFAGPCEVLSHFKNITGERLCTLTVAADKDRVSTPQGITIGRDVTIDKMISHIADFDVLLIPGGHGFSNDNPPNVPSVTRVIEAFLSLPSRGKQHQERFILSICAGAFFLAQAGILSGRTATAHYGRLTDLSLFANRHGTGGTRVVRQHYVDCGVDEERGLRIITSGGITSGLDATLYLAECLFGKDVAEAASATLDYTWRREMTPFGFSQHL